LRMYCGDIVPPTSKEVPLTELPKFAGE